MDTTVDELADELSADESLDSRVDSTSNSTSDSTLYSGGDSGGFDSQGSEWIEDKFITFDGLELFYCYRKPKTPTFNALLLLHRGHEHSIRMQPIADTLSEQQDCWSFAFDMRGHGRSDGEPAWAESFDVWVQDLNSFAGHIQQRFGVTQRDTIVIANSVSSVTAVSWIINYGANVKGCVLAAPAFAIKLYIPLAMTSLKVLSKFTTDKFVTSYVKSKLLTRDESAAKAYDADPLITKKIGVNVLVTLHDATKQVFRRLPDFEVPTLLFSAENDYIVKNNKHQQFFDGISSDNKQHIMLPKFRHAVFFEKEPERIVEPTKQFIASLFAIQEKNLPAIIPQARQHTLEEYKKLIEKDAAPKQIYYGVFRWLMVKFGKHSHGVATGLKYGFDSGVTLDYVYRNEPTGTNWFGKMVDKTFLRSVGWQGIRTRKQHLKITLKHLLEAVYRQDTGKDAGHDVAPMPVVLDMASGPGRYLFEIADEMSFPIQLCLNDNDPACTDKAKALAKEFKQTEAQITTTDLFEDSDIALKYQPDIIIVSGVFELYDNNSQVHQALVKAYNLLPAGGYLLYTGQPWHPQMETIGRLLNNRLGKRWVMRRRIQREMDQLVEAAGFTKLNTITNDLAIFTVSCAHKPG